MKLYHGVACLSPPILPNLKNIFYYQPHYGIETETIFNSHSHMPLNTIKPFWFSGNFSFFIISQFLFVLRYPGQNWQRIKKRIWF